MCCLWGTYAEQIEAFRDEHQDRSIVALIRFAKINFFRGISLGSSYFYIDFPLYDFK